MAIIFRRLLASFSLKVLFAMKEVFSLKNSLLDFTKRIDLLNDKIGVLVSLLFFPGWILVLYSVVVRYFFNAPTYFAGDLAKFLFSIYFVMGGAYCLLTKIHIRVDVIYNLFSKKTRRMLELLLVFPLLFAFHFPFIWQGSSFAWSSLKFMELSPPPTSIPVFAVKFAIPITGVLILLQALADLYRYFYDVEIKEEDR